MRRLVPLAVVPLLLVLVACDPTPPPIEGSPQQTQPSSTPTPTLVVPVDVDPADYLIEGNPGVDTDGDGFWSAHYAFFTDEQRTTRCDIRLFSASSPVASCSITPGNEALVTYALPAGAQCDLSTSNPFDGYTLALGALPLGDDWAGFSGCAVGADSDPALNAVTRELPDGAVLTVDPFRCSVVGGTAECAYLEASASIRLGLDVATFTL